MTYSLRFAPLRILLGVLLALGLAASAGSQPRRHDGLAASEKENARAAALQALPPTAAARASVARQQARGRSEAPAATPAFPAPEQEVLLVDRHKRSKQAYQQGAGRAAEVYVYDYTTDTLKRLVVSMPDATVETVTEAQGVQLPLNDNELQRAMAIAQADPEVQARLEASYADVAGEALVHRDQLHVKAMAFHARSMPEGLSVEAQACGLHRCAQLLLYTHDEFALDLLPIVDLSTGRVVHAGSF